MLNKSNKKTSSPAIKCNKLTGYPVSARPWRPFLCKYPFRTMIEINVRPELSGHAAFCSKHHSTKTVYVLSKVPPPTACPRPGNANYLICERIGTPKKVNHVGLKCRT